MNHEEIRQALGLLHDGELAGDVRREVETHLGGCAECRAAFGEWDKIVKALFRSVEVIPSENFVAGVMNRIAMEEEPAPVPRAKIFRWVVPALSMAVAALFLFLASPETDEPAAEDLLLANGQTEARYQWFFLSDRFEKDDILNYMLEES